MLSQIKQLDQTETAEFSMARITQADRWVPACGGKETPFRTRTGRRLLYCWNAFTNSHAYLDLDTDIILSNEESSRALDI